MTTANCGIILSGHFNVKIIITLPWDRGNGKLSKLEVEGDGCNLVIFAFAPNLLQRLIIAALYLKLTVYNPL